MAKQFDDASTMAPIREDLALAADYLSSVFHRCDAIDSRLALRQLVDAHGGVSALAQRTHLSPLQIRRMVGTGEDSDLHQLMSLLEAMGLRLAVKPK